MDETQRKRNAVIERLFDSGCISLIESGLLGYCHPTQPSCETASASLEAQRDDLARDDQRVTHERNEALAQARSVHAKHIAEMDRARADIAAFENRARVAEGSCENWKRAHAHVLARADRAERALKRAGFEDRDGEEWAPPVCPAETKIATFRADEPVSWHELTDRARHMSADGNVVLTAAQVRALESDVAALTQGASRPHMVGTSAFLDASTTTCVHGAWLKCPACPKDSVVRGETAYKTPVGHKVTGPELVWTMRDEFAKATMQTGCSVLDHMIDAERAEIAQRAYAMADAMIKAREKKP